MISTAALPLVIIRPEPGCTASVAAALELGLVAFGFPLFQIVPRDWTPPATDSVDALLIGSANALRHGGAALDKLRHLPVHCVGEATALAARTDGFTVATVGSGGLQPLLSQIAPETHLLRLAGEERVSLDSPPGVSLIERVVYTSQPSAMTDPLAALLQTAAVVMLHSGEAARHFSAECDRRGIARGHIHIAALAPRVTEAAGQGWASTCAADQPSDAALLALAHHLCQSGDTKRG